MAMGQITRGTTGHNRLRRIDRWLQARPELRAAADPLVVDLGYGASGVTVFELAERLRLRRPDVEVLGIEIDPERVATARRELAALRAGAPGMTARFAPDLPVSFAAGGFELPVPGGRRPAIIRAFNVLRQYGEQDVPAAWEQLRGRLAPGSLLVEGTCDELGRVCCWVALDAAGPRSLTIALRLRELAVPSIAAERLPKALIHRNVPGERVHALLTALEAAWLRHAPLSVYGPAQRWIASLQSLRDAGVPVLGTRSRWRLGELEVPWDQVAPG